MPFSLDELGDDAANIMCEQGETVTYNPLGVAGSAIEAIVLRESVEPEYFSDGEQNTLNANVQCVKADVPAADDKDSFTFDGKTWAVIKVADDSETSFLTEFEVRAFVQDRIGGDRERVRRT